MAGELIQTPQTLWKLGAYESVQRGTPIVLGAYILFDAVANRYTTARQQRTASGYQVPTGKTLYVNRLLYFCTSAAQFWGLAEATADVGHSSAAAPAGLATNAFPFGTSNPSTANLAAHTMYDLNFYTQFPAGLYPTVHAQSGSGELFLTIFGHEE